MTKLRTGRVIHASHEVVDLEIKFRAVELQNLCSFYIILLLLHIHFVIINSANNHSANNGVATQRSMCFKRVKDELDTAQASKSFEIYSLCCISFDLDFLSSHTCTQWAIFSTRL